MAYGYLKGGKAYSADLNAVYRVEEFIEKPDSAKASEFLENGNYLWNSGIIVCKVSTMLDNIMRFLPRIYRAFMSFQNSIGTVAEKGALKAAYAELPAISIDYGVMERSEELLVIPGDFKWSDMGGWDSFCSLYTPDKDNNIIKAMHAGLDTSNSVIFGGDRLIATIGVDSLIVVECEDSILVCHKDRAQEVKKLVEMMKNSPEYNSYL
jgi:mannose-1-phosphate guanylyltransferase